MATEPTFLLVHGSWHGPWCFEPLQAALRQRGVDSIAVALPSVGTDVAHLGTLADDATVVTDAAAAIDGPVVVVGHSYGGAVITEGRWGPQVARLIYLGAFMPDTGRSYPSYLPPGPLPPYVEMRDDGTMVVPAGQAIEHFYADCSPETGRWAEARLRPQSQQVLQHAITAAAWRAVPSTYVMLTEDRAIPPDLQRMFAGQADDAREFVSSHSPFLSRPDDLAALFLEITG